MSGRRHSISEETDFDLLLRPRVQRQTLSDIDEVRSPHMILRRTCHSHFANVGAHLPMNTGTVDANLGLCQRYDLG